MHLLTTHLLTEFSYQSTGLKNVCARLPNSYVLCLREEVASLTSQNLLLSHDLFFSSLVSLALKVESYFELHIACAHFQLKHSSSKILFLPR